MNSMIHIFTFKPRLEFLVFNGSLNMTGINSKFKDGVLHPFPHSALVPGRGGGGGVEPT